MSSCFPKWSRFNVVRFRNMSFSIATNHIEIPWRLVEDGNREWNLKIISSRKPETERQGYVNKQHHVRTSIRPSRCLMVASISFICNTHTSHLQHWVEEIYSLQFFDHIITCLYFLCSTPTQERTSSWTMNVKVKGSLSFGAAGAFIGLTMTCISIHPSAAAYHTLSSGEYHIHIENINNNNKLWWRWGWQLLCYQ